MSVKMSGEPKMQEVNDNVVCQHKCRIPQRLPLGRQRVSPKTKVPNTESTKNKTEPATMHHLRHNAKTAQLSNEVRPKSANRAVDNVGDAHSPTVSKSARPERERVAPAHKKPVSFNRRTTNEKSYDMAPNKTGRNVITVPVRQRYVPKTIHNKSPGDLPDQETIKRCEELELQHDDFSDAAQMYNDMNDLFLEYNDEDTVTSKSDQVIQLKNCWQEHIVQFETMKNELNDRQNAILEVYAKLRNTQHKLMAIGQRSDLPSTDDLRIMNVANMTPNQLLQLCAETKLTKGENRPMNKNALTLDMKKLNEMPLKLVSTCEQTLILRKELIDWFENLKNQDKGCTKSSLSKKINEFNAEHEMLNSTLETVKKEFLNELTEFLRTCWNKSISLQLQNEELIYEISEMNTQNAELKKKIFSVEKQKAYTSKLRVEELEKELKEEKDKRILLHDRLTRTEGQVKMSEERASLLESALNQAQRQTRVLERSIQELNEQNNQLQKDFDDELHKLKDSMKKNTTHLEDIAKAREILQQEKDDLKKKLEELSKHYNESLSHMKQEHSKSIAKFIDAEKKYNEELEEKKSLQNTVKNQCARLVEYELRHKDTLKQLHETEKTLSECMNSKDDYERVRSELDEANSNLSKLKSRIIEQTEARNTLERDLKKSHELEKKLNRELQDKIDYIASLQKNQNLLQQQLQENEGKMEIYEEQLISLKNHITTLQDHLVKVENINELKDMVNRENNNLKEARTMNDQLTKEIQQKQMHLNQLMETIAEQEDIIKQRHSILQQLSEKENDHSNILQLTQSIAEKETEIESLITNIKTRKEQISQLEKIILAMENQSRKVASQRKKDQDKIKSLEKKLAEYEYYISNRNDITPPENLDNLIKILEEELGAPLESQLITNHIDYDSRKNKNANSRNECYNNHSDFHREMESNYQPEAGKTMPTKIVMGNFVKKTYIPSSDDKYNSENLHRKQAITNIDTQKWLTMSDGEKLFVSLPSNTNNNYVYTNDSNQARHQENFLKKLQYLNTCKQSRDEKKSKMYKLASHRLA